MMVRADLVQLLGNVADDKPVNADRAVTSEASSAPQAEAAERATDRYSGAASGPEYLTFVRKETRLRPDQLGELTDLARRLARSKLPGGHRITENTLIRIGVDLLVRKADELDGSTEAELRQSAGLT